MTTPHLGDTVAYGSTLLAIADDFRHQGTVVAVANDGWITVEIPQDGTTPMRIRDRAENFTLVRTLPGEIERLTAELASARTEVDVLRRTEAREIRALREQLDDARDKYGDKLCPRCSVEVAAEAAAEKESTREGETP